jgi:meso-butanediol dehydrogenase / (S,S)-butanediol dehydrogenase / diacetyl reductase
MTRAGRLSGKCALVTGIGGGIGREIARVFCREGAHVLGSDVNADGLVETADLMRDEGGQVSILSSVDLGSESGATQLVEEAVRFAGRLDVLVNNASSQRFGAIDEISVEDYHYTIRNEIDLVFLVTRSAWPHLKRTRGVVVNIASRTAVSASIVPPQNVHGAAKGAVVSLTYHLAAEGAPFGIRANAVSPGLTVTPASIREGVLEPGSPLFSKAARNPLGRAADPIDAAYAALYLASDESGYVTAQNLIVDGGASRMH